MPVEITVNGSDDLALDQVARDASLIVPPGGQTETRIRAVGAEAGVPLPFRGNDRMLLELLAAGLGGGVCFALGDQFDFMDAAGILQADVAGCSASVSGVMLGHKVSYGAVTEARRFQGEHIRVVELTQSSSYGYEVGELNIECTCSFGFFQDRGDVLRYAVVRWESRGPQENGWFVSVIDVGSDGVPVDVIAYRVPISSERDDVIALGVKPGGDLAVYVNGAAVVVEDLAAASFSVSVGIRVGVLFELPVTISGMDSVSVSSSASMSPSLEVAECVYPGGVIGWCD